jgi:hypothetical protein
MKTALVLVLALIIVCYLRADALATWIGNLSPRHQAIAIGCVVILIGVLWIGNLIDDMIGFVRDLFRRRK